MQAEPDSQLQLDNKVDVDGINFRPSTNFKHMKKYRKGSAVQGGEGSNGTRSEEEGSSEWPDELAQPPLPREPPPPDSPPVQLKMEVLDEEYGAGNAEEQPAETDNRTDRVMCRKFARGACPHGDGCRFVHEIIISQLPGIFTFCNDFQNTTCTRPFCKFVHATVFEKEYFYRTGFLPEHATAHMKQSPGQAAPATPNPVGAADASAAEVLPKPVLPAEPVAGPSTSGASTSGGGAEIKTPPEPVAVAAVCPDNKRKWREPEDAVPSTSRGPARPADPPPSTCSTCELTKHRLQSVKNKVEKVTRTTQEVTRKKATLDEKLAKQRLVMNLLSQYPVSNDTKPGANLFSNSIYRNNSDKMWDAVVLNVLRLPDDGPAPGSPPPGPEQGPAPPR